MENKLLEPGGLNAKFSEYKGEFKRISWLTLDELKKNTVTCMGICIIFFIIIFCYDMIFTEAMTLLTRFVG